MTFVHIQKWIDVKNKRCKYIRILQELKKIFQKLQNCSQRGLSVTLLSDVTKNLLYNKSCVFSKELTWHRSPLAEIGGNRSKNGF